ncbi:helix-turn-helix domain-containing protein [Novipirellula aureliae]|nr:helix-turn-helix domain-containing protein [Novipirellula aureliae]
MKSSMLTVNEVADRLNVAPSTVYGLLSQGRLKCYRIGLGRGTIRVSEDELARFLAATVSDPSEHETEQPQEPRQSLKHIKMPRHA